MLKERFLRSCNRQSEEQPRLAGSSCPDTFSAATRELRSAFAHLIEVAAAHPGLAEEAVRERWVAAFLATLRGA